MSADRARDASGLDPRVLARLRDALKEQGDVVIRELLLVFAREGAKRLAAMERALLSGDVGALQIGAHTMRGSAELIGAQRLADLGGRLEHAAREGQVEELGVLFADLRDEYQTVDRELEPERRGRA